MYIKHFGLATKPFSIVPNPDILFLSKNHKNALTYLEYGLTERVGFILLTGEIGVGKTTLIRHMLNKMADQMDIAVIFNTNFPSDHLYRRILGEFEVPCDTTEKERHLEMLYRFLIDRYARGRRTLLIIDEAQNLSDTVLEDIRMLSNLQTDDQILLQILLVGQTELRNRLASPGMCHLTRRIVVNYHLPPLDQQQTCQYIAYRIESAGGPADLFTTEAMQCVHQNAGGIPRTTNLLCSAALVYGYAENVKRIDRAVIEKVLTDRICLTVAPMEQSLPPADGPSRNLHGDDLSERVTAMENRLAAIEIRQEKFMQEIRSKMDLKIQATPTDESAGHHRRKIEDDSHRRNDFAFTDSGDQHPLDIGNEPHPSGGGMSPTLFRHHPMPADKPSVLSGLSVTQVLLLLIPAIAWTRRMLSHRNRLWMALLLVLFVGLVAVWMGGKKTPHGKYADLSAEEAPDSTPLAISYQSSPMPAEAGAAAGRAATSGTVPPSSKKTQRFHTIKAGETLSVIAKNYGVTVEAITSANHLTNSHFIRIGQKLEIPVAKP